ncbi:M16 family metallopeptidase [Pontibacter harenae]|uniref:M16 family metallopeptidase n=1 Tax=Pontibacter harenae TaxID=2894083 RepID=UPI001E5E47B2|nr:pitrilysin family protein [Pontibacter harenae]MCC9166653.1 insulinase family protein [Pontibacter harenae]
MLDRSKAPEIYEVDAVALQFAEVTNLSNGSRLHIIKNETQPVIRLDFVFKAGKWYDTKHGVSDLATKMLLEGSQNYTAKQIADTVAYYGASFDSNHQYDRTEYTLYCLSKYLDDLLPLIVDILQNPVFPEEEFNLLKQRTSQNIKVQRQKNSYLSTQSFTKLIYGSDHPYQFGFEQQVIDSITLEDVKAFYQKQFSTEGLEVFACGSLDEDSQRRLVNSLETLAIAGKSVEESKTFINDAEKGEKEAFREVKDSLQSSIKVGRELPLIQHEDYHKLVLLNEVLGGYFGSRLMRNIREDKGYTYGIYSAISPRVHSTLFYIGTDVNYAVTENTLTEIHKEINLLQTELIPEDELVVVQNYMIGKFINDMATIFDQCDRYKRITLYDLPHDHYSNFLHTIRNTSAEELRALANQYLKQDELYTAIAGRKA